MYKKNKYYRLGTNETGCEWQLLKQNKIGCLGNKYE